MAVASNLVYNKSQSYLAIFERSTDLLLFFLDVTGRYNDTAQDALDSRFQYHKVLGRSDHMDILG